MRPARQPTDVRSSSSLALLITLCLVLQWGGARIFNFDPSAIDGGTKGTALSQVLLFSTNAVALWIVLTSPNTRDLVRRCWPIMLLPGLATVSALWHSGYLEVLVAFGYLSALVVIMVHFWLFKGTRSLLLTAAKKHAHLAAIPISLIFVAGLLNYSESLLMSYASIFTELTPLAAAWVFQLTSPYALAQDQQCGLHWQRVGRVGIAHPGTLRARANDGSRSIPRASQDPIAFHSPHAWAPRRRKGRTAPPGAGLTTPCSF